MATVNYIRESKQTISAMKGLINYCIQDSKVNDDRSGRRLISGINCNGENAFNEFMTTKYAYKKLNGTNFYQYVQSFSPRENVTAEQVHKIGLEFAEKAWRGYEVLVTTHTDAEQFKWRMKNEVGFLAELVGMFSNRTEWHPRVLLEPTPQNCKEFMQWLKFEWQELPDAVPTSEVSRLLGCRPQLIHQIAREGGFTAIKIGCTQYISKKELIIYASSPEKVSNPTGETYKTLIKTFKAKRSREIENEKRREKRRLARIEKGY